LLACAGSVAAPNSAPAINIADVFNFKGLSS